MDVEEGVYNCFWSVDVNRDESVVCTIGKLFVHVWEEKRVLFT